MDLPRGVATYLALFYLTVQLRIQVFWSYLFNLAWRTLYRRIADSFWNTLYTGLYELMIASCTTSKVRNREALLLNVCSSTSFLACVSFKEQWITAPEFQVCFWNERHNNSSLHHCTICKCNSRQFYPILEMDSMPLWEVWYIPLHTTLPPQGELCLGLLDNYDTPSMTSQF